MPPKKKSTAVEGKDSTGSTLTHFATGSFAAAATELDTSLAKGLTGAEAAKRLERYGPNELPEEPATPWWELFKAQFEDGLVRILLSAAGVSFAMAFFEQDLHGFVEPAVILLILILNAVVGVWQENRAESAIEALKSFVPKSCSVLRDGKLVTTDPASLVPGDVVEVAVGSRIPADLRVCELLSTTLRVDQAILTGESLEVIKQNEPIARPERLPLNFLFSGTAVVYGKARAVVLGTGTNTEIGRIEKDVREQEESKTPLQVKLDEFGDLLSKVIGWICLLVFAIHVLRWMREEVRQGDKAVRQLDEAGLWGRYASPLIRCLKVAVALAVAAIPEGLPAVVTTCLALGTRRMASHNALVRELPSVETLGRCTVICSDKTGTLTTNMMSVREVITMTPQSTLRKYIVEDSKFNVAAGAVRSTDSGSAQRVLNDPCKDDTALKSVMTVACSCNDAALHVNDKTRQLERIGEATEAALLTMAEKFNVANFAHPSTATPFREYVDATYGKNATLEFTRQRKSMGVHCTEQRSKTNMLFVKGAPEALLERSVAVQTTSGQVVDLTPERKKVMHREISAMSGNEGALRCIGFAFKLCPALDKISKLNDPSHFAEIESGLTFVGVAGMLDPPRMEVREAIKNCNTAGIRVIVITGDNKQTAESICRKIGIFGPGESTAGKSFTGEDFFSDMTEVQRRSHILNARLFSRTDPSHKMALVKLLQEHRLICAMTGDGVNDAPALKKSDIGIAMGSGTEVAKSASKMVLADDNFATVVKAVKEGRAIYNNTKQFIRYLISSNIGEVACILVTGLTGIPDALEPVQLLWVNLVTDGLPATALGFNPPDPDIMEQAPRKLDEPIVNGWLFFRYMVIGTYVGLATVGGFVWWFLAHGFTFSEMIGNGGAHCTLSGDKCALLADPVTARAVALSILVVVEMFNALNALSENQSIVSMRPTANPWLLLAIASSMILHFAIMYVPVFANIFSIAPLGVDPAVFKAASNWDVLVPTSFDDWKIVLVFSMPVVFLDELLKLVTRMLTVKNAHVRK